MDRTATLQRAEDKIIRLSGQGLDVVAFWRACTPVLADAVPHYMGPCCYTLDPGVAADHQPFPGGHAGVSAGVGGRGVRRGRRQPPRRRGAYAIGISTLHEATNGDPSSSPRWHANMAYGGDQEMVAALRTRSGEAWGAVTLYREPDRPLFDPAELAFVRAVSQPLADGVRRGLLVGEAADPEGPDALRLWSCSARTGNRSRSRPAPRHGWTTCRTGTRRRAGCPRRCSRWPGRARRAGAEPGQAREVAEARVLTRSGRWVVLHGIAMVGRCRGGWRCSSSRPIRRRSRRC